MIGIVHFLQVKESESSLLRIFFINSLQSWTSPLFFVPCLPEYTGYVADVVVVHSVKCRR